MMQKRYSRFAAISCREYAKVKGVEVVGKLRLCYEAYGFDRKHKVYIDEAGTKYYPSRDYPTVVLADGTIL